MSDESSAVDLSICIASYNTAGFTKQCLMSIFENVLNVRYEVIVVDNNSHDGSADMIRREFPLVKLICNSFNAGVSAATNQGIHVSNGRYFLTMNSDVVIQPGALERLVEFMDAHKDAGAATARLVLPDGGEHPPICGNVPTLMSELLDVLAPLHKSIADAARLARFGESMNYNETQEVACILWGTALIVRKELIDSIGGQDESFFVYGEDTDWTMRIVAAGWKLYYVADAVIIHYGGRSTGQSGAKMVAQLFKSRCRRTQKHYGFISGWILRLVIGSYYLLRIIKSMVLYIPRWSRRGETAAKLGDLWKVVRAVLTY